jgi:hypothetical protein
LDMSGLDPENHENVAAAFGVAHALACEIMYENDEFWQPESPEGRWWRMRRWVKENIRCLRRRVKGRRTQDDENDARC